MVFGVGQVRVRSGRVTAAGVLVAFATIAAPLASGGPVAAAAASPSAVHHPVKTSTHGDLDGDGRSDVVSVIPERGRAGDSTSLRIDYSRAHRGGSRVQFVHTPVAGGSTHVVAIVEGDFNGDGFDDLALGVLQDRVVGVHEVENGTVYVYRGGKGGLARKPAVTPGPADGNNEFGAALAAGASNGDRYADLAVGDPVHPNDDSDGTVSVFTGSAAGLHTRPARTLPSGHLFAHGRFGSAMTFADVNGDGHGDLVVGEPDGHQGPASNRHGDIQVVDGTAKGLGRTVHAIIWGYKIGVGSDFGSVLASGNVNGRPPVDVVASAPGVDRIVLLTGGKNGLSTARSQVVAVARLPHAFRRLEGFGTSLAIGDVTGDGRSDVVVGARDTGNEAGAVVVVPGGAAGLRTNRAQLTTQATRGIPGFVHRNNQFGKSLAVLVTGQGRRRAVVIGTPGANLGARTRGAAFVLHGDAAGLSRHHVRVIKGAAEHDRLGEFVAG